MGLLLTDPAQSEWFTDADSALGMSGASVLDDGGFIVGLFWVVEQVVARLLHFPNQNGIDTAELWIFDD